MSKLNTIHVDSDSDILRFLKRNKTPFKVFFTNNTTKIETAIQRWVCLKGGFTYADFAFMKKVKKEVEGTVKEEIPAQKINYFSFRSMQVGTYDQVEEIDLNGAYWKCARNLGYISEDLYKEGLTVDKKTRLAALGGLATMKTVYEFDGKKEKPLDPIFNPVTRSVFFDISRDVGSSMMRAMSVAGRSAMFMWVDAMVINSTVKQDMQDYLRDAEGYETKNIPLSFLDVYDVGNTRNYECYLKYPDKVPSKIFRQRLDGNIQQRHFLE